MALRLLPTRTAQRMFRNYSRTRSGILSMEQRNVNRIILYDVPSRPPCQAWSPNTWKVRFLLNYKRLDYKTKWVEFPNLGSEFASLVSRNQKGPTLTLPVVQFDEDHFVMGSKEIAHEICKRHPSPTINIDSADITRLDLIMPELYATIAGTYMDLVPKRILNEPSRLHWIETRELRFGMPLDRLQTERGGEQAWIDAKPYLHEVTAMLGNGNTAKGSFFQGNKVSYADFQWGAFLMYIQTIGADIFERMMNSIEHGGNRVHRDLLVALAPWASRKN